MKLIIFDLDGTLTESKQPIAFEMVSALKFLADDFEVAFLSGCHYNQMQEQVVQHLPDKMYRKLLLLPTRMSA